MLQPAAYHGISQLNVNKVGGQIIIQDSPDASVRVSSEGTQVSMIKQEGQQLKINNVGGTLRLEILQGVNLNLSNVGADVNDTRQNVGGGNFKSLVPPAVGATQENQQIFHRVSEIVGVNQPGGEINILLATDGVVKVSYAGAIPPVLDQDNGILDLINRPGSRMTIHVPASVKVEITGGQINDQRLPRNS